jgi:hypothetical protein
MTPDSEGGTFCSWSQQKALLKFQSALPEELRCRLVARQGS